MSPIGLLAPGFLLGLAALAIPIAIHLIHRRKARVLDFPTLRFLREVERRLARRRRLDEMLLLLARCAAVGLVALALARPLLRPTPSAGSGAALTLAIALDDSASMRAVEGGVPRFERAQAAARAALATLGPGDRAALLLANGPAFGPTADLAAARRALDAARPSFGAKPLPIAAAAALLAKADTAGRALVVAGDLQRGSLPEAPVRGDFDAWVVPAAVGPLENATLRSLDAISPVIAAGRPVRVRATIENRGDSPAERAVTFLLDGRPVAEARVALPPRGRAAASADLPIPAGGAGWHEAVARLDADAFREDDEAHLALEARSGLPVLLVGAPGGASPGGEAFFLLRALEAGGAPLAVKSCRPDAAARERLADYALAVCFGAPPPALMERLGEGGGLLVVGAGEPLEHGAAGALALGALDDRHPLLEPLAHALPPVELGAARFFRTTRLALAPGDAVIARFTDGAPALVERRAGAGRALFLATGLTPASSNFPLKVGFVPFVASAARWLAAGGERTRALVGEAIALSFASPAPRAVRAQGVERPVEGGAVRLDPPLEPGFVRLEEIAASGAPRERRIAVDPDPGEGDLAAPAGSEAAARLFERGRAIPPEGLAAALERARRGVELGAPLLLLAAAILLGEAWLANRVALGAPVPAERKERAPCA
jgi:hypothetical protein